MDQGLTDQNSKTRDFSPVNESNQAALVRSTELELPSDGETHDSASNLEGVSAQPFVTRAINLGVSKRNPESTENSGFQDGVELENMEPTRQKRVSKPSAKLIDNRLQCDTIKLERIWERAALAISTLQGTPDSIEALRKAVGELRSTFSEYQLVWVALMDYTVHTTTPEQRQERQSVEEMMRNRKELVQTAINEGIDRKNDLLRELGSARSGSHASRISWVSSHAIRAHARGEVAAALKKAEMQRKINEFRSKSALALELEEKKRRDEELAFERKKREEEARLESLRAEQAAAVAVARAKAIDEELGLSHEYQLPDLPLDEPSNRVQAFINNHLEDRDIHEHLNGPKAEPPDPDPPNKFQVKIERKLDPGAPPFSPVQAAQVPHPTEEKMETLIQFMARRELISNKIEKFDNRPENFHTWRASFKNTTRDVIITPSEELSLLIEYTSGDSKCLVQRLHNAFIEKPAEGVKETWKKLEERFGSNAVITQVHLKKLTMHPTIGLRDNKGLQELGDLLLELQCAKQDGGLVGLKILDEPAFLKPLLVKLPEDLQGRWQRHAYRYKTQRLVDYPPFSEFAKFVQEIARERNDPYLSIEVPERRNVNPYPVKTSVKLSRPLNAGRSLTVNKTELEEPPTREAPTREPSKWCFIHRMCHPLGKCRAFRAKPLSERRNLLSQHGICFRCLSSSTHLAKDCVTPVKCSECQSDRHVAALHAGPPASPQQPSNVVSQETPTSMARSQLMLPLHVQRCAETWLGANRAQRFAQQTFIMSTVTLKPRLENMLS